MRLNLVRLLCRWGALALVLCAPDIASSQVGEPCPIVPKLLDGNGNPTALKAGHSYYYSLENVSALPNIASAAHDAFEDWTKANTTNFYGSQTSFWAVAPGNGAIKVVARAPHTSGGISYTCVNPQNGPNCIGEAAPATGGTILSGTIYISAALSYERALNTMLHELQHFGGSNHPTPNTVDARSLMGPNTSITEISECDANEVGRNARGRDNLFRADPCIGQICRGHQHPIISPCLWGTFPNGQCFPDFRYKHAPPWGVANWNDTPIGAITSPTVIGTSGAVTLASRDRDGSVMRVDWYVNDQYFYTSTTDPFDLPYSNAPPGVYKIAARMFDDFAETSWTAPVWLEVQGTGSGASFATLGPWGQLNAGQRLFSPDGSRYLVHQSSDGHLVEYINNGPPVWATGFMIAGGGGYTHMDGNTGNFVSYRPFSGGPYWSTNTFSPGASLRIYNDGRITIATSSGSHLCTVSSMSWGVEWCPP